MKSRIRKGKTPEGDAVADYVRRLERAGAEAARFDAVFDQLAEDRRLTVGDVVAVARGYTRISTRLRSRTLALAAISKRFVAIVKSQS